MPSPLYHLKRLAGRIHRKTAKEIRLKYGVYDCLDGTLHTVHDAGIGSCMSVTLRNLIELENLGIAPVRVCFSKTMQAYKDGDKTEDLYPRFFSASEAARDTAAHLGQHSGTVVPRPDASGRYADYPFALYAPLVNRYFTPSAAVLETLSGLLAKYEIDLDNVLSVCIRGTDKHVEVRPIDSAIYIRRTEQLLERHPLKRVLIQTDQEEIATVFLKYFGETCFCLEEIPRVSGATAVHQTSTVEGRRTQFAMNILAVMLLMSKSGHVLTHTGNIGAWIALYRGGCGSLHQMMPGGEG